MKGKAEARISTVRCTDQGEKLVEEEKIASEGEKEKGISIGCDTDDEEEGSGHGNQASSP